MIKNLIKEGSLEEADSMFSSMEKSGCAPSSRLLNDIIRTLLKKGEVVKAVHYMCKVDGKSISLEASTTSLLLSLFSGKGEFQEQINLLPAKYQFFDGVSFVAQDSVDKPGCGSELPLNDVGMCSHLCAHQDRGG
jgi:pentatricopeptide repeat protein